MGIFNAMTKTIETQHTAQDLPVLPEPEQGEERVAAATARLCRAMGVKRSSVDEPDAEGLTPLIRAAADFPLQ